jgi:DNA invertase Pin-like site-specific DNA recombinase
LEANVTGQRIGYKRVSTVEQNTARQLDGVAVGKVFEDKASGKDRARPQLQTALEFCREGDTLVVHSMDRLARNLSDLRLLVNELTTRGVAVEFVKEHLTFTGEDSPMSNLLLSMLGAVAEFERALLLERQREGIALAKAEGKYKGRKQSLSAAEVRELVNRATAGDESKTALAQEFGISRETLYAYLRANAVLRGA